MPELLIGPPPPAAIAAMVGIPGVQISPSILATQSGPAGGLGPEGAGAVLMLQATFSTSDGAAAFWGAAVPLMAALADAPGFIRRWSFPDGPSITLIALWRSVDDARAFASSPAHRAASADLFREHWQYSHFSALWELCTDHGRVVLCPGCGAVTRMPARECRECREAIVDPFGAATPG